MEEFSHPEFLIATDALERRLGDPDLRIFDCTIHLIPNPNIGYTVKPGREDFEKGHIPGAQFIDLQADLSAPHPKLRFMLPSADAFAAAMGRFGVGENSRVVLYSTTTPQWRAGSGGCCAITGSTMRRCSTAGFRNGLAKAGRSRPARPNRGRRRLSLCG